MTKECEKRKKKRLSRRESRVRIVELLYMMDIHDSFRFDVETTPEEEFVVEVLEGLLPMRERIDGIISDHLTNYTIKRLNYVDRAILRLATYELLATETPTEIVIDEALELTHLLSDEGDKKHVSFNNRVLDNVKNTIRKA